MMKPGIGPETVAVRETLAETGVHCRVNYSLGGRLHPATNVFCDYLFCDYLTGEVANGDVAENVRVTWVRKIELGQFIPYDRVFPPVLEALELANVLPGNG
jgi:8-oxo-dGTP diphosphatase